MKWICRLLACSCMLAMLSGCTPLARGSYESLRTALLPGTLTPDEATLDPTAAYMLVRSGKQQLLLGRGRTQDQGMETWYTSQRQVLVMRDGLLASSAGLPVDLLDLRYELPHPLLAGADSLVLPAEFVRHIRHAGKPLESTRYALQGCGEDHIKAWRREVLADCFREVVIKSSVARPLPGNVYWLSRDTKEWVQTLQWVSPDWPLLMQPRPGNPPPRISPVQPVASATGQPLHLLVAVSPTRLSELLLSYPLPDGALAPAYWLTHEAREPQRKLKLAVLFDLGQALAEGRFASDQEREALQLFRTRIAAMPVTGRRVLPTLQPRWLQANPGQDPVINGGDQLVRRFVPASGVTVVGNVGGDCQRAENGGAVLSLLQTCLGPKALPDTVYVIAPDGLVRSVDVALWNRVAADVAPGSVIFVPFPQLAGLSDSPTAGLDIARWLATQTDIAPFEADRP